MHFIKTHNCPICAELGSKTHPKCTEAVEGGQSKGYSCRTAFKHERDYTHLEEFWPNGSVGDFSTYFWLRDTSKSTDLKPKPLDLKQLIAMNFPVQQSDLKPWCANNSDKDILHYLVVKDNPLEEKHVRLLQDRGLYTERSLENAREALKRLGFVSLREGVTCKIAYPKYHPLPGFTKEGVYTNPSGSTVEGLGIPKRNAKGQLLLWQIKPDGGKYYYPAAHDFEQDEPLTRKHDTRTGRIPLNVVTFTDKPTRVLYTEGVLKSIITAYKHRDSIVIGGEGSLFCTELALRLELEDILKLYPTVETTVYIAPDSGSAWTQTHHIKTVIKNIVACGWDYGILDWGQLYYCDDITQQGDPDEVDPLILNNAKVVKEIVVPNEIKRPTTRTGPSPSDREASSGVNH